MDLVVFHTESITPCSNNTFWLAIVSDMAKAHATTDWRNVIGRRSDKRRPFFLIVAMPKNTTIAFNKCNGDPYCPIKTRYMTVMLLLQAAATAKNAISLDCYAKLLKKETCVLPPKKKKQQQQQQQQQHFKVTSALKICLI
jgi:hypothetical protein